MNDRRILSSTSDVQEGHLKGATGETDYFYFFCPKCPDREIIMRILEYGEHVPQTENEYNPDCKSHAKYGFILSFKLYCEKCGHSDFIKVYKIGWQMGKLCPLETKMCETSLYRTIPHDSPYHLSKHLISDLHSLP
jgi:hypothetical protein